MFKNSPNKHFEVLPLWHALRGLSLEEIPQLTVHLAPDPNGAGVIVCPGGGYRTLASDHEGLQVAQWLNKAGIHAFVLRYRLGPKYHSSVSLRDGKRAVRMVRHRSSDWGLDPNRLGMLGFSAGGHLALATGLSADAREEPYDAIDSLDSRPNFLVPAYAVTNGAARGRKADEYWPIDTLVNSKTPPTFIMHTHEDSVVPASQATLLYDALLKAGVPAELHIFNHGNHGLGLNRGGNELDSRASPWGSLLLSWLLRHGFLNDQIRNGERCTLEGQVSLDDEPIALGWLSFIPQGRQSPMIRVRLTSANAGRFHLDAPNGPVPGPHRMVLHMVSEVYPADSSGYFSLEQALCFEELIDVTPGVPVHWRLKRTDGVPL
jgi:acetyl esterase/lipase